MKKFVFLFLLSFSFIFSFSFYGKGTIGELEIRFAYKKAVYYLKQGEWEKAKDRFLKILEVNPNIFEVYANLGYVFEKLLAWREAKKAYQKALELAQTKNTDFLINNLANVSLKLGDEPEKWIKKLKVILKRHRYNSYLLDTYGYALVLNGNYQSAKRILERAIRFGVGNYWANYHLGLLYFKKGDFFSAETYLEKALQESKASDKEVIFIYYKYYLTKRQLKYLKTSRKLWNDFLVPKLEKILQNKNLLNYAGYQKFYQLMKRDLICQYRLSLFEGFYGLLRKRREKKLVLNVPISLEDIENFYLFKGIKRDEFLYQNNGCSYKIDGEGKVFCLVHGYSLRKEIDLGEVIRNYYDLEDNYEEILFEIKSIISENRKEKDSNNGNKRISK